MAKMVINLCDLTEETKRFIKKLTTERSKGKVFTRKIPIRCYGSDCTIPSFSSPKDNIKDEFPFH